MNVTIAVFSVIGGLLLGGIIFVLLLVFGTVKEATDG